MEEDDCAPLALIRVNAAGGQMKTFSRDELWKTFGPQTLQDLSFVGRVAKMKTAKGIFDNKAVM